MNTEPLVEKYETDDEEFLDAIANYVMKQYPNLLKSYEYHVNRLDNFFDDGWDDVLILNFIVNSSNKYYTLETLEKISSEIYRYYDIMERIVLLIDFNKD